MELHDELAEQLAALERDQSYTTERLLKENELERTEVVRDASDQKLIRKYITSSEGKIHPYELLLSHPCLHAQRVVGASRVADKLVVYCEYAEGTDLRALVEKTGPLSTEQVLSVAADICGAIDALAALGTCGVVHRDINPSNIIVGSAGATLVDFGIARMRNDTARQDTHLWGTKGYVAPEQFGFKQTDTRADIYSLAMTLRFALTGCRADADADLPARTAAVIAKAMSLDPEDRHASARDFCADLAQALRADGADGGIQTARERMRPKQVLWRIWQVVAWILAAAFVDVCIRTILLYYSPANVIAYVWVALFWGVAPCTLATNTAHVNDKISFFAKERHFHIFIVMLIFIVIGMAMPLLLGAFGIPTGWHVAR